jgi:hypothetical protein
MGVRNGRRVSWRIHLMKWNYDDHPVLPTVDSVEALEGFRVNMEANVAYRVPLDENAMAFISADGVPTRVRAPVDRFAVNTRCGEALSTTERVPFGEKAAPVISTLVSPVAE